MDLVFPWLLISFVWHNVHHWLADSCACWYRNDSLIRLEHSHKSGLDCLKKLWKKSTNLIGWFYIISLSNITESNPHSLKCTLKGLHCYNRCVPLFYKLLCGTKSTPFIGCLQQLVECQRINLHSGFSMGICFLSF